MRIHHIELASTTTGLTTVIKTGFPFAVTHWSTDEISQDKVYILKKWVWFIIHSTHSLRPLLAWAQLVSLLVCLAQNSDQTPKAESGLRCGGRPVLGVVLYCIWGLKGDIWFQDCQYVIYTHACTLTAYCKKITFLSPMCLSTSFACQQELRNPATFLSFFDLVRYFSLKLSIKTSIYVASHNDLIEIKAVLHSLFGLHVLGLYCSHLISLQQMFHFSFGRLLRTPFPSFHSGGVQLFFAYTALAFPRI